VIYVGTAGWNIPRAHKDRFPESASGSGLQRYAARLNAAEINSSFYRPHARATYERWSASVPAEFRFSVKIPKVITHERALARARDPLTQFLDEVAGLGTRLGPLLLQLPPSHAFDARRVGRFFDLLRSVHEGPVVCEPRHQTWTSEVASRLLLKFNVARVAADPPRAAGLDAPGGSPDLVYYRWHGSPRPYFSPYSMEQLRDLAVKLEHAHRERPQREAWCIFDNTGSGSAAGNALDARELVNPSASESRGSQRSPKGRIARP
jgi:uncharacterized protein YecE (DUF72 family)